MTPNPHPSPESLPEPQPPGSLPARRTLEMLRAEHGIVWLLLPRLGIELCLLTSLPARANDDPFFEYAFQFFAVGCGIALSVFVFRGARTIFGPRAGALYALASLVPCLGVLVALGVLLDLRDVLRQTGAEVPLWGATTRQIKEWQEKARSAPTRPDP